MKALNLKEFNEFELIDVRAPELETGEVLVQVNATGACGSDVHGMDGSSSRPIPPIVLGHESAGVITQVGVSVTSWDMGDRVSYDSTISCGQCKFCDLDQVNLCRKRRLLGVSRDEYRQPGAFTEFVNVPERILYSIPDSMTFQEAAFCDPVVVALHAVSRVDVKPGDTASDFSTPANPNEQSGFCRDGSVRRREIVGRFPRGHEVARHLIGCR
ncbi:MAG: alcohol dehydrogenase catalytic domain-containing protein [Planctomycetota bacterium]